MLNALILAKLKELHNQNISKQNEEFRNRQNAHIWEGKQVGGRLGGGAKFVVKSCPHCATQTIWKEGPLDPSGIPSYSQPTGTPFNPPF